MEDNSLAIGDFYKANSHSITGTYWFSQGMNDEVRGTRYELRVTGCALRGASSGLRAWGQSAWGMAHGEECIGHGAEGIARRARRTEPIDLRPECLPSVLLPLSSVICLLFSVFW